MTRSHWNAALAEYQREEAAYAQCAAEYEAACRAVDEECPCRDDEFCAYGLKFETDRHRALVVVGHYIEQRDHAGKTRPLTVEEQVAISGEQIRIVSNYFEYRACRKDAYERLYEPAEKAHDEAVDKCSATRGALLGTPAPDKSALLAKLDLLASIMTESDEPDAPRIAGIRDDARRLLSGEGE